jgi:hypothetical protein
LKARQSREGLSEVSLRAERSAFPPVLCSAANPARHGNKSGRSLRRFS